MKKLLYSRIYDFQRVIYLILFFALTFSGLSSLFPCNVPVFRYALERWTADPYRLTVFYHDEITSDHKDLLAELNQISFQGDSTLNIIIEYSDLNNSAQNPLKDFDDNLTYPLMMLSYPEQTGIPYPIWLGELSKSNMDILRDSPLRREISDLLLAGETAVFLFLESGEPELDQKYYNILVNELEALSAKISIPTSGVDVDGNPIEINDFQNVDLSFSVKKLSRKNPKESIFVKMLLGTESDLAEYQVPLVFPVFGQGRSLYALVGAGINKNTIEKACGSLVDWCSCEIKALHQGVDLLFLANWSASIGDTWIKDEDPPPLTGLSGFIPSSKKTEDNIIQTKPISPKKISIGENIKPEKKSALSSDSARAISNDAKTRETFSISKNIGWLLLGLTGLVIMFTFFIMKKKTRIER